MYVWGPLAMCAWDFVPKFRLFPKLPDTCLCESNYRNHVAEFN